MNKGQLIEAVAADLNIPKAAALRSVDAVLAGIVAGVKRDDSVTLAGFGSFAKKQRAPRSVRNPSTGQMMTIDASTTVAFKPSQVCEMSRSPPSARGRCRVTGSHSSLKASRPLLRRRSGIDTTRYTTSSTPISSTFLVFGFWRAARSIPKTGTRIHER